MKDIEKKKKKAGKKRRKHCQWAEGRKERMSWRSKLNLFAKTGNDERVR